MTLAAPALRHAPCIRDDPASIPATARERPSSETGKPTPELNGRDRGTSDTDLTEFQQEDSLGVATVRDGMIVVSGAISGVFARRDDFSDGRRLVEGRSGAPFWPPREPVRRDSGIWVTAAEVPDMVVDPGFAGRPGRGGLLFPSEGDEIPF